jgi:hypothetical protein
VTSNAQQAAMPDLPPVNPFYNPNDTADRPAVAAMVKDRHGNWRLRFNIHDDDLFERARVSFQAMVPTHYRKWVPASDEATSHWLVHPNALPAVQTALKDLVTIHMLEPTWAEEQPAPPDTLRDAPPTGERHQVPPSPPERDSSHEQARDGHESQTLVETPIGAKDAYRVLALRKDASVPNEVVGGVASAWRAYWYHRSALTSDPNARERCLRKVREVDVAERQVLADLKAMRAKRVAEMQAQVQAPF